MSITHRNTETIDRYDIDVFVDAHPGQGRSMRVTEAKVEISLAETQDAQEGDPEGALYVEVTMWGRVVKGDGLYDKRFQTEKVVGALYEQGRYELERTLVRDALARHHQDEALVIHPDMQSWQAHQHMMAQA